MDFEMMIEETKKFLEKSPINECTATALFTDKGNIYVTCCNTFANCCEKTDDDFSLLNDLIKSGENRILKMVTIFKQGDKSGIEVPCGWLRKYICEMNNDNINAEVKVNSEKGKLYLKDFFVQ